MGSLISVYPGGAAGLALLILRISLVGQLLFWAFAGTVQVPDWGLAIAGLIALGLAAGFFTPVWAVALSVGAAMEFFVFPGSLNPLVAFGGIASLALALLSPGAYSIDACLFGRRVISLDN